MLILQFVRLLRSKLKERRHDGKNTYSWPEDTDRFRPACGIFRYQLLLWHNDRNSGFDGGNDSCYNDHFLGGEVHPSYARHNMPVNYGIWWSHFIF